MARAQPPLCSHEIVDTVLAGFAGINACCLVVPSQLQQLGTHRFHVVPDFSRGHANADQQNLDQQLQAFDLKPNDLQSRMKTVMPYEGGCHRDTDLHIPHVGSCYVLDAVHHLHLSTSERAVDVRGGLLGFCLQKSAVCNLH